MLEESVAQVSTGGRAGAEITVTSPTSQRWRGAESEAVHGRQQPGVTLMAMSSLCRHGIHPGGDDDHAALE